MTKRNSELLEVASIATAGIPLTDPQASMYLQLAKGTLSVWRCKKLGPKFVLVSKSPRYLKTDLDAYIASCQTQRKVSPNVGRPVGKGKKRRAVRP